MKKFSIEFKWATIFVVISLLWTYLEESVGMHGPYIGKYALYTNLFGIFAIALYLTALYDKKKNYYNGQMDWTRGFLTGLSLTVIIAVFSPLTQMIATKYISPQFLDNMQRHFVESGALTQKSAEAMFNLNTQIIQGIFTILSMGVVGSAILAWVVRSKEIKS